MPEENANANPDNGGNNGNQNAPAWTAQLEADLKSNETFNQYQTISDLGKAFIELRGKAEGAIKVPGEGATAEEILAFRQGLGVPEKPENYKIERPQLPEGMPYDETLEQKFKETAINLNMTPNQVQGLYNMFLEYDMGLHSEAMKMITENRQKSVDNLKKIWQGDAYKENIEKTTRAFHELVKASNPPQELGGVEGITKWFDENGIGDDPVVIWLFKNIFEKISDDKFIFGAPSGEQTTQKGMLNFPSMQQK
jgi:hypothetical protein